MKNSINKLKEGKTKQLSSKILGLGARYYLLFIIGFIVLYPFLYMFCSAIKDDKSLIDVSLVWIPKYFSWDRFKTAFDFLNLKNALKQTFLVHVISALIEVFVCAYVAYGFARFKFKGKTIAMLFLILSLLIPMSVYSTSLAVNYRQLDFLGIMGLFDKITGIDLRLNIHSTEWTFWLPSLFGVGIRSGMLIFIYIQFFEGLPYELEDAAYIDGAGPIKTFLSIALPSSSVVIVTVTVLSLIWHWNETSLSTLVFMNEDWPLSVAINNFVATLQQNGMWLGSEPKAAPLIFAASLLFMAIPLGVYLILQRKFVKSIDRVGITG